MSAVYAVANQKGGVGKTTTTINLGAYLALAGKRVLVVDLDPQANTTSGLGLDKGQVMPSVYEALIGQQSLDRAVLPTSRAGLDIAPSALRLAGAEIELVGLMAREQRLAKVLQSVAPDYDFVLVDCPPSLGLLTVNALTAANGILVPIQCEYLALEALGQLMNSVQLIRDNLNPGLEILGMLMTMFDARTNLSQQVVEEVRSHYPTLIFKSIIPRSVRMSEAPSYGQSILDYDAGSKGALAYRALADEVICRSARQQTAAP